MRSGCPPGFLPSHFVCSSSMSATCGDLRSRNDPVADAPPRRGGAARHRNRCRRRCPTRPAAHMHLQPVTAAGRGCVGDRYGHRHAVHGRMRSSDPTRTSRWPASNWRAAPSRPNASRTTGSLTAQVFYAPYRPGATYVSTGRGCANTGRSTATGLHAGRSHHCDVVESVTIEPHPVDNRVLSGGNRKGTR